MQPGKSLLAEPYVFKHEIYLYLLLTSTLSRRYQILVRLDPVCWAAVAVEGGGCCGGQFRCKSGSGSGSGVADIVGCGGGIRSMVSEGFEKVT